MQPDWKNHRTSHSPNAENFFQSIGRLDGAESSHASHSDAEASMHSVFNVDVIQRLQNRGVYTKDFEDIRRRNTLVFIYDFRMKSGGIYHDVLKRDDVKFMGDAYTATLHYTLMETYDGQHQGAFKNDTMNITGKGYLWGQVYYVTPEVILDLDRVYQNGEKYQRTWRNVMLADQELPFAPNFKGIGQTAWIYMGRQEYWDSFLSRKRPKVMNEEVKKMCWLG